MGHSITASTLQKLLVQLLLTYPPVTTVHNLEAEWDENPLLV